MLPLAITSLVVSLLVLLASTRFDLKGLRPLGISWFLFSGYEFLMHQRFFCSGECNLRVDLILLAPFILIPTLIVAVRFIMKRPAFKPFGSRPR